MRKIEANCNSPEAAIRSHLSSDFLSNILKSIHFNDTAKVIKIFNKVKTHSAVDDEEYSYILSAVESDEFKCAFYEKIRLLDINPKKKWNFTFEALYNSFYTSLITSRTIHILQRSSDWEDISRDWENFRKVMQNDHKTLFLKLIEEFDRYYIALDIRSWKNRIFSKEDNHSLVETYADVEFWWYLDRSRDILLASSNGDSHYIIFWEKVIAVSKDFNFHEWKYSYYIIDSAHSFIYQIDKETLKLTIRDYQNINFVRTKGKLVLTFLPSFVLETEEWKWFTPWLMSLLDIYNGQDVFSHIHLKFHELLDAWFIWLSSDLEYFYIYNSELGKKKAINVEECVPAEIIRKWWEAIFKYMREINNI